jgi:cation:H+ antiporter
MQISLSSVIFAIGLGILYFGAETMLKGSVQLARSFGIRPLLIGLTLVAFGTSAPELSLDLTAAFKGTTDLAFGDLVGSNIANVGLIAGVAAVIRPIGIQMRLLKVEVPIAIAAALGLWGLSADGRLSRLDGGLLLIGLVAFVIVCYTSVRRESKPVKEDLKQAAEAPLSLVPVPVNGEPTVPLTAGRRWRDGLLVIIGLTGLVVGAQLMVHAALDLARQFGVSEVVIGLTIVAVGTSLPELATCAVGAWRDEPDIVMGNVVGSNIFNLLCVMGLVALVQPLQVHPASLRFDLPVMGVFMLGLVPIMLRGLKITRGEGVILLAAYMAYLFWRIVTAKGQ